MKPSTSALKHFVLCATATAVVSSWSLFVKSESESEVHLDKRSEDESMHSQNQNAKQPFHDGNGNHHTTIKTTTTTTGDTRQHRDDLGMQETPVLVNQPKRVEVGTRTQLQTATRTPCVPDLGVLACPKTGQICQESSTSKSSHHSSSNSFTSWHCVSDIDNTYGVITQSQRLLQLQFPPDGPFYYKCTYTDKLEYVYESSIRYPSAWDRCVCKAYDYQLKYPTSEIYSDVEYCHKINKYYCANFYDSNADNNPNAYDVCLCSTYDGKSIPDKPNNFCQEIPKRYCDAYYPGGDLVGIASCLCDTFGYQDWCDFEPPEGFVPITQPTPAPPAVPTSPRPTTEPTRRPTGQPTRKPTRNPTRNPTRKPTRQPTRKPTVFPTENPTPNPTLAPETGKKQPLTKPSTPAPSNKPTRRKPNMGMMNNNNNNNSKPTTTTQPANPTTFPTQGRSILFPGSSRPTQGPTPKASSNPTQRPSMRPSPTSTEKPSPNPTPEPTPKPSPKLKPDTEGDNISIDNPLATENDLYNVKNLYKVITSVQRQPNISNRPGVALRLKTHNIFSKSQDNTEYGIGI